MPPSPATRISGWGHYPVVPGVERRSEDLEALTADVPLTRGLGRAYGDAALPANGDLAVAGSVLADRVLHFDPASGEMTAEAGLSLDQLYRAFLPKGWFTPVTPGTRFVTLGGMVAADVHGKNHHVDGCFGRHVTSLRLRVADGRIDVAADQPARISAPVQWGRYRLEVSSADPNGPATSVTFDAGWYTEAAADTPDMLEIALDKPELGLSNWEHGRLFARSGVLGGDSAFTLRLRAVQRRSDLHR